MANIMCEKLVPELVEFQRHHVSVSTQDLVAGRLIVVTLGRVKSKHMYLIPRLGMYCYLPKKPLEFINLTTRSSLILLSMLSE